MILKDKCRKCGGAALQLFNSFECVTTGCGNFSQKLVDETRPKGLPVKPSIWKFSPIDIPSLNAFQVGDLVEVVAPQYLGWFGKQGRVTYVDPIYVGIDCGGNLGRGLFLPNELKLIASAVNAPTPTNTFKFAVGDRVRAIALTGPLLIGTISKCVINSTFGREYHVDMGTRYGVLAYSEHEIELDVPVSSVAKPTFTFVVGDRVMAKVGGFTGKVVSISLYGVVTFELDGNPSMKYGYYPADLDLIP